MHLHICRPRSLVEREIGSTYTCIIDSLPVLGYFGASFAKDPRKTGERPGSLLQGSAHRRQPQVARAKDGDCLHLTHYVLHASELRLPCLQAQLQQPQWLQSARCKQKGVAMESRKMRERNFFLAKMAFSGNRNTDQLPYMHNIFYSFTDLSHLMVDEQLRAMLDHFVTASTECIPPKLACTLA